MRGTAVSRTVATMAVCCAFAVSCSSSGGGSPSTQSRAPGPVVTVAPSTPSSAGGGGTASALDGTWNGTWQSSGNGPSGTFSVTWTESGSDLNGTLSISVGCLDGASVTGTVDGSSIEFGSVKGQCQVDYKGDVSGDQMSGTYDISGAGGGTWTASKA
jgi:hypothetical protein